jgi:hypothetical protein
VRHLLAKEQVDDHAQVRRLREALVVQERFDERQLPALVAELAVQGGEVHHVLLAGVEFNEFFHHVAHRGVVVDLVVDRRQHRQPVLARLIALRPLAFDGGEEWLQRVGVAFLAEQRRGEQHLVARYVLVR